LSAAAAYHSARRMLSHALAAITLDNYADLLDDDLDTVAVALNDARPALNAVKSFGSGDLRGRLPPIYWEVWCGSRGPLEGLDGPSVPPPHSRLCGRSCNPGCECGGLLGWGSPAFEGPPMGTNERRPKQVSTSLGQRCCGLLFVRAPGGTPKRYLPFW